jgi:hypothetical protein
MPGTMTQRLAVAVGVLILAAGVLTLALPVVSSTVSRFLPNNGVALTTRFTVTDAVGVPLAHRLVVVFADGRLVGRTDESGLSYGTLPPGVTSLADDITLREGAVLLLSHPPAPQVVAYAFPGDRAALSYVIQTCPLGLSPNGVVFCPSVAADVPPVASWLMAGVLVLLLFGLASRAGRHVVTWSSDVPAELQPWLSLVLAALMSALVVVMFMSTGVINEWVLRLTSIFSAATTAIIGAIAISVGFLVFFTQLRSLRPPKR